MSDFTQRRARPMWQRPPWQWPPRLLAAALGVTAMVGFWLYGLVTFLHHQAPFEATLPRIRPAPPELHNLSRWDLGPTVRASSFYGDWGGHHHPLFVVDGRSAPDLVEKWASAESDAHPWIEVRWREPHTLERVVLRHAGSVESGDLTARRYRVQCLQATGRGPAVDVESNSEPTATHELRCEDAHGIRVEVDREGKQIARIFEVETWGR